jgi:methyl-accepting chemotaxis protein
VQVLNNLSIAAKSLLSTLIGAIILASVAGLATVSLLEISRSVETAGQATTLRSQVRGVAGDLSRGQAALYRSINLKAQNVEVPLVRAAKVDALGAIASTQKALGALRLEGLAIDAQLVSGARATVDAYAAAARQAADFVEDDAFNATMFRTDAEQRYATAEQHLSELFAAGAKLADLREQETKTTLHRDAVIVPVGAFLAMSISAALSTVLSRLLSRPIKAMITAMRRLADGDLATDIPAIGRTDEVGQMAQAMLVFRGNAQQARELQAAAEETHALTAQRQAAMDQRTHEFGSSASGVMNNLAQSAEAMRAAAADMLEAAKKARENAARTADGAAQSAQNLAAVAAAAEEMAASISEISQQVTRATEAAHGAV